jgi:hypothetical protein
MYSEIKCNRAINLFARLAIEVRRHPPNINMNILPI